MMETLSINSAATLLTQLASCKTLETTERKLGLAVLFGLLLVLKTDVSDSFDQCAAVRLLSSQPKQLVRRRALTFIPPVRRRRDRAKRQSPWSTSARTFAGARRSASTGPMTANHRIFLWVKGFYAAFFYNNADKGGAVSTSPLMATPSVPSQTKYG